MDKSATTIRPVFIFSLPRSGSTLLQRVLSSHEEIASTAEPWLLLPLCSMRRTTGVYTDYAQFKAIGGIEGFLAEMADGEAAYQEAIRQFALFLYAQTGRGKTRYFLDKTPRYSLIVDDILKLFPEAKVIFLWRNPVSIVASMVRTWTPGYWGPFKYNIDLYHGILKLIEAAQKCQDRAICINYEDLLRTPENVISSICTYLELDYRPDMLSHFSAITFKGTLGDPTGVHQYDTITAAPLDKWKKTICNPYRRRWCNRYLDWLGQERLAAMGYELSELKSELGKCRTGPEKLATDLVMAVYGFFYCNLEPRIFRDKLKNITKNKPHIHG